MYKPFQAALIAGISLGFVGCASSTKGSTSMPDVGETETTVPGPALEPGVSEASALSSAPEVLGKSEGSATVSAPEVSKPKESPDSGSRLEVSPALVAPPSKAVPEISNSKDAAVPSEPKAMNSAPAVGDTQGAVAAPLLKALKQKKTKAKSPKARVSPVPADTILIECTVKLPDDPTENSELCRNFQMAMLNEAGEEISRFRFDGDGSYRFSGKPGMKYRVRPLVGKNWEVNVFPDRELAIGERAHIQLRQKE